MNTYKEILIDCINTINLKESGDGAAKYSIGTKQYKDDFMLYLYQDNKVISSTSHPHIMKDAEEITYSKMLQYFLTVGIDACSYPDECNVKASDESVSVTNNSDTMCMNGELKQSSFISEESKIYQRIQYLDVLSKALSATYTDEETIKKINKSVRQLLKNINL